MSIDNTDPRPVLTEEEVFLFTDMVFCIKDCAQLFLDELHNGGYEKSLSPEEVQLNIQVTEYRLEVLESLEKKISQAVIFGLEDR